MTLLDQAAADPHAPAVDDLTSTRTRGEVAVFGIPDIVPFARERPAGSV